MPARRDARAVVGGRRGFVCLQPNVRTQRVARVREAGEVRCRGMEKIRERGRTWCGEGKIDKTQGTGEDLKEIMR